MSAKARSSSSVARLLALALAVGAAAGCSVPKPQDAYMIAQPKTDPTRTVTNFSGALDCMDGMFVTHGVNGIQITSVGLPDATGAIATGTREMLITAISRMTRRSDGFRYNDWELERQELNFLNDNDPSRNATIPTYYIRGAITQLDQRVSDWRKGGGLSVNLTAVSADVSHDKNQTASVVALDMNVGLVRTRQILPGLSASNSIAVSRRGEGWDAGLAIEQAGAFFSIEQNRSEGAHQSVRTLVELGLVEVLGKLARVPYWECLQIEATNPRIMEEVVNWYNDMSPTDQVKFVQRVLIANGYMAGPATGNRDEATREAIARYQADNDVIPNGRISFDLYRRMLGNDRPIEAGPPTEIVEAQAPDFEAAQMPIRREVSVSLKTVRGDQPTYAPFEALEATATVTEDAYVYCYYQDGRGHIARVFPNRFEPDAYVPTARMVKIPTPDAPLQIVFDNPGSREELMCLASARELGLQLPHELKKSDLEPLPVQTMEDLISAFERIDSRVDRNSVSVARMPIVVSQN